MTLITDFKLFLRDIASELGNCGIASSRLISIGGVILFESKSTIQTSLGNLKYKRSLILIYLYVINIIIKKIVQIKDVELVDCLFGSRIEYCIIIII